MAESAGRDRAGRGDDPALHPDRFYVMGDAGSFYFDDEHPDGFDTPEAAAEWAKTQTGWEYGTELDFSDGVSAVIVLGREINEANAAWERWAEDTSQPYPSVSVRNFARDLHLVDEPDA